MRYLGLIVLCALVLAIESALCRVLHIGLVRPDPVLVLVVFLAFRTETAALATAFVLGVLADGFAGTPTGMLTSLYVVVFGVVRGVQAFLIPDRTPVQVALLVVMGLVFNLLLILWMLILPRGAGAASGILIWMVPISLLNAALAGPLWSLAVRILGRPERDALFKAS